MENDLDQQDDGNISTIADEVRVKDFATALKSTIGREIGIGQRFSPSIDPSHPHRE